jgi:phosphoserine phosphatase
MTAPDTAEHSSSEHALVFAAPSREAYREALLALSDLAHARGLPPPKVLSPWEAAEWIFPEVDDVLPTLANAIGQTFGADVALIPTAHRRKRLLLADMDSTMIGCECLDELADFAGLKAEIAAITERAMRGELAFEDALHARVGMLKGLSVDSLQRCYVERVRLNPGARALVGTMRAHGAHTILVSGGFTFFTSRVAQAAGFDRDIANTLLDDGAVLTGMVASPIIGRAAKRDALVEARAQLGLAAEETLAIGDGANDLDMVKEAGLGIAFHAKPIVAAQAKAAIQHTSLATALFYQGYRRAEFVEV